MNTFTILAFLCAFAFTQVIGDELDDLRAEYVHTLELIRDASDDNIVLAQSSLEEAKLYFNHANEVFLQDGESRIFDEVSALNATAAALILEALANNAPAKVLTCISNARDAGDLALNKLITPYQKNLQDNYDSSSSSFQANEATIEIIKPQLQGLFDTNAEKINTCVVESCFDNCIADATKQFKTVDDNVNSITDGVKASRISFNAKAVTTIETLRTNTISDREDAEKKMGKC